jgi:putative methyltransferase (TIGR04325 family)
MIEQIKRLPGIRELRRLRYEHNFAGDYPGMHSGVFKSFAEAAAGAPKTKRVGFDQPAAAAMYRERLTRLWPSDYPVVFWLSRLLTRERMRLFDFGGHVGIAHYSYEKYIPFPADLDWTVFDVPEVIRQGAELARERNREGLHFTGDTRTADGADVYLAAGSLQFAEISLGALLDQLTNKPPHLIINKMPLYDGETFVTLQNNGAGFHPHWVLNRGEFLRALEQRGYEIVDRWTNLEHTCHVPFPRDIRISPYDGYYLRHAR